MEYLIGFDIGTSFVKATLMSVDGECIGAASAPAIEQEIISTETGWAEQEPETWWNNLCHAALELKALTKFNSKDVKAVGITYQMHGLVLVNKDHKVLRPSIIWCDGRAVEIGENAFQQMGETFCLEHYLNSPGNFTASKLRWVKENEPEVYHKIHKAMLPGDFIAMKMTGEINTTVSSLSEGILWDLKNETVAQELLDFYEIEKNLLPEVVPTFAEQGRLSAEGAEALGLDQGIPITYRAGDQPNNAFSLNVLEPGEVAATAGTSGVIYAVHEDTSYDPKSRVNTFVHVNHTSERNRYGTLLCVNGTGIMNSWLKRNLDERQDYEEMNELASQIEAGAEGVQVFPFGNGAERTLGNTNPGASIHGLDLNRHSQAHLHRAAQEGIVYALNYGFEIMHSTGIKANVIRAGDANMFLSPVFKEAFVNVTGVTLELYNTDGSLGAARGAGLGVGIYKSREECFAGLECTERIEPDSDLVSKYEELYQNWLELLNKYIDE